MHLSLPSCNPSCRQSKVVNARRNGDESCGHGVHFGGFLILFRNLENCLRQHSFKSRMFGGGSDGYLNGILPLCSVFWTFTYACFFLMLHYFFSYCIWGEGG